MGNSILSWIRKNYNKAIGSIAFYPALIAIGFLGLSWIMLELDYSKTGKHLKSVFEWIRLRDASTARTIVSTILAGIISLTVFSFSMVMILLNQAASQMSNRMLENMIGNNFQKMILGVYIGSIVYSLFLLTSIRDVDSGVYVPALSIYLLLVLTVLDIFLFIYFLHYVTQSVKFEIIIERVHKKTLQSLNDACTTENPQTIAIPALPAQVVTMSASDYFQGFGKGELVDFALNHNIVIEFLHIRGSFLLKGTPLLNIYTNKTVNKRETEKLLAGVDFYSGQRIDSNPHYGYHQLTEVALKALSPGINDPETAVLSIHAITDLLEYRLDHFPNRVFKDGQGTVRIIIPELDFGDLFSECFEPIWNYGKNDLYIRAALTNMLTQLKNSGKIKNELQTVNVFLQKLEDYQTG